MIELTQSRLHDVMDYYPDEGIIRWRLIGSQNRMTAGSVAGCNSNGYVRIEVDGRNYTRSRLVWFFVHGRWPVCLDHKNGVRHDDRLVNLREVSFSQNSANSAWKIGRCGFRGVRKQPNNKFVAQIQSSGKKRHLGVYATAAEAAEAYRAASEKLHGEFAFHRSRQ
jgi:hypothetical protein